MQNMQVVPELFHNGRIMKYNPARIILKKDYVRKDGTCAVYMQVIINRRKKAIPLSIFVNPNDFENGRIKGNGSEVSDNNLIITDALAKASDICKDYRLKRINITLEAFVEEYNFFEMRGDFYAFFEKHRKQRLKDGSITLLTYEQNGYVLDKLKDFRPEVKISDLNCRFLNEFNRYLIKIPNNESTRRKAFDILKTYILLVLKENHGMQSPFDGFEMPVMKDRIVFLTKEELKKIYDYYFSADIIEGHVKPLCAFLWMCFTSLRVSDCFNVSHEMIHDNMLVFTPLKNRKKKPNPISIPLHAMAKKFIETEEGKLIEGITPQKCNEAYKQVATKLEIKKNITNHVARHTFATQFIINGGDVMALNKILDHSTLEQTRVYVHISSKYQAEQSNKVFDNFFPEEKATNK